MARWIALDHVTVNDRYRAPGAEFEATPDQVGVLPELGKVHLVEADPEPTVEPEPVSPTPPIPQDSASVSFTEPKE